MSLEATKRRLSRKYLGRGGIHGIGLSRARNAVCVHLAAGRDAAHAAQQNAILDELKHDASPYEVLVTVEERARLKE
jgi:hypothetical protein